MTTPTIEARVQDVIALFDAIPNASWSDHHDYRDRAIAALRSLAASASQVPQVQELRQLIEAYASMRYRSGAMNYSEASSELQEEAVKAVQAAYEPLDAVLRALAPQDDAEALARRFHDLYERLAPQYGYETRPETRAFDPQSANGKLMIAVCAALAPQAATQGEAVAKFPREPNEAMQAAGAQAIRFDTTPLNKLWTANAVWRAMHDALINEPAPAPSKEQTNGN